MNSRRAPLLGTLVLFAASPCWAHGDPPLLQTSLKFKAAPKWTILLPNETWTPVGSGLPIPHAGGDSFPIAADATALRLELDTNADGQFNQTVKGNSGYALFQGKTAEGGALAYAARFKVEGSAYKFASSGYLQGTLEGVSIRLIDQNNNGRFDEIGVDAMVVGNGNAASFLSKVVNLNGVLYEIELRANGQELTATPFTGETGTVNLVKGFASTGKLNAVVVSSQDGSRSFELASGAAKLPVGSYRIAAGLVSKANETVRIAPGRSQAIEVEAGKEAGLEWGNGVVAEFTFAKVGEEVTIQPTALKYYGRAGEEYLDFLPQGASPKFSVFDATTKKLLKTGRFGGC